MPAITRQIKMESRRRLKKLKSISVRVASIANPIAIPHIMNIASEVSGNMSSPNETAKDWQTVIKQYIIMKLFGFSVLSF